MTGLSVGYVGFLVVALATHAIIGYTIGTRLFDRPWTGVVGALAADVDFLFPAVLGWPFVHRGITHTVLVAAIASVVVIGYRRSAGGAFAAGYASHLLIDSTTPKGVPFLYPLVEQAVYVDLPTTGHSPIPTLVLWLGCLFVLSRGGLPAWLRRPTPARDTDEAP